MTCDMNDKKVLGVDDDPYILKILGEMLARFGCKYTLARDGVEALEILEKDKFCIVITDICMPRMDGIALTKEIRKRYPYIDIIIITGYDTEYTYTDVIRKGASDYISKPFNIDELEAKIRRILREQALKAELFRLSIRDGLTDLYNRRYFDIKLREEVGRTLRQGHPLFLVLFDIDRFKDYNDKFGHQKGDRLLKEVATIIFESTRKNVDSGFRYGGDEFAIIIPYVNRDQCHNIAERVRLNYNKRRFEPTSLSLGVAPLINVGSTVDEHIDRLIHNADQALYRCKREGGDKVCFYPNCE
nr:diguanylate cyclase [Desulfobacterales bacterium]